MTAALRSQRAYDHRLRALVQSTGDPHLAIREGVPQSTARGWLRQRRRPVVSIEVGEMTTVELQRELIVLRRRLHKVLAILRLVLTLLRLSGFSLAKSRLPDGRDKSALLRTIERSRRVLSVRAVLRVLRLSARRYHSWKREDQCGLDDATSCPRTAPQQLTRAEVATIKQMATSDEYCHVPTSTLALLAQRLGKVFASAATWCRLVRRRGWRRPRARVHPSRPRVRIRALAPNELWHIDATVIRLLDNTRAYLHAVIDNYSRRILAWTVADRLESGNTVEVLVRAAQRVLPGEGPPAVLVDGGSENFNGRVDEIIESGILTRVLALTEVAFSNSMIECWWRALKHQWLYLNSLDNLAKVRQLAEFYVDQHNSCLPHSAFQGQTPDEVYFATGDHVPADLEAARKEARKARLAHNRTVNCANCEGGAPTS